MAEGTDKEKEPGTTATATVMTGHDNNNGKVGGSYGAQSENETMTMSEECQQQFVVNMNVKNEDCVINVTRIIERDLASGAAEDGGGARAADDSGSGDEQACGAVEGKSGLDVDRRHSKSSSLPHGVKLCPEEGSVGSQVTEENWANLTEELRRAQSQLKAKDEEVEKLKGIRQQVEGELEDLTASLFQEAHKMVKEAKMKEISSEKSLTEAKMQLDGLQAEVAALKALVITSTPSRPNMGHLNNNNGLSIFKKQHKRCPSHNQLNYGRNEEDSDSKEKMGENKGAHSKGGGGGTNTCGSNAEVEPDLCSVDPVLHKLFGEWRTHPDLNREKSSFLTRVYQEDIDPCLDFVNVLLVDRLKKAIENNSIWVEPLPERERNNVLKECSMMSCPRICHYRMRFDVESDNWFDISQMVRDRVAAVCEFLNYLRYTNNGLVKASVDDAYWEIIRLRKQMTLAKLGIPIC